MTESAFPPLYDDGKYYGSDDHIDLRQLVPGVTVRRYTEPASAGQLEVPVPCCDRRARLRSAVDEVRILVGCPFCGLIFEATAIDEGDGGWSCLMIVTDIQISLARRRRSNRRPRHQQARS